jgi:hypothetical protein
VAGMPATSDADHLPKYRVMGRSPLLCSHERKPYNAKASVIKTPTPVGHGSRPEIKYSTWARI